MNIDSYFDKQSTVVELWLQKLSERSWCDPN